MERQGRDPPARTHVPRERLRVTRAASEGGATFTWSLDATLV